MPEALERGVDLTRGGAKYNHTSVIATGVPNVGDSLAAVRKLVFEEGKLSMEELLWALKDDFEGKEILRQMLLNRAPKWGNDDDYVDSVVRDVVSHFFSQVQRCRNNRGGRCRPVLYTWLRHLFEGTYIGATPDGRKARAPIAQGIMPVHGRNAKGISAAMKSLLKLDFRQTAGGPAQFVVHPSAFSGPEGTDRLMQTIETYFKEGGMHVMLSMASRETLKKARANPEGYRDLMVRVTGFSAYFTSLDPTLQDEIIKRTEVEYR
jgi:formate C-acetyltransferase